MGYGIDYIWKVYMLSVFGSSYQISYSYEYAINKLIFFFTVNADDITLEA